MKKHFKSRYMSTYTTEKFSKSKSNIEFFSLLKNYLGNPDTILYLNVPETIVMNCPDSDPFLIFTGTEENLLIKEDINSE
jgi:hypothetical protein